MIPAKLRYQLFKALSDAICWMREAFKRWTDRPLDWLWAQMDAAAFDMTQNKQEAQQ